MCDALGALLACLAVAVRAVRTKTFETIHLPAVATPPGLPHVGALGHTLGKKPHKSDQATTHHGERWSGKLPVPSKQAVSASSTASTR